MAELLRAAVTRRRVHRHPTRIAYDCVEIASIILLLGAQVIAEYERLQHGDTATLGELQTDLHASKWDDHWSLAPAMCRRAKAARAMTLIADPRR